MKELGVDRRHFVSPVERHSWKGGGEGGQI